MALGITPGSLRLAASTLACFAEQLQFGCQSRVLSTLGSLLVASLKSPRARSFGPLEKTRPFRMTQFTDYCSGELRMKRFILTGAPGAGKTVILRQLELDGFSVVEEAATDVIALQQAQGVSEPWTHPSFIDSVADLQRWRQLRALCEPAGIQFHDRSAVCTAALAQYLGHPVSDILLRELKRIETEAIF